MKTQKKPYIKKKDVKIGGLYVAKISGKLTVVQITSIRSVGGKTITRLATQLPAKAIRGWFAVNLSTGKPIAIKSHMKLRLDLTAMGFKYEPQADTGTTGDNDAEGARRASPSDRELSEQIHR